jgi:ABC-2 type transport system permease protein
MNSILLIARRDLGAYLFGLTGYVIVAAVLFLNGLAFQTIALGGGPQYSHTVLEQFFYFTWGFTVVVSLLLTMRSIAEERQYGTDVLLHTAPVTDAQIVLGKYLAAMGVITLFLALTVYMPALIFVNGKVSIAHIGVGYLGMWLTGSAAAAIGIFGSSLFRSQVAAVIISGVITVTLIMCWKLSELAEPPFTDVIAYTALFNKHFVPFQTGRIVTSGIVFYASLTFVFLMLTTRILEGRRWQ